MGGITMYVYIQRCIKPVMVYHGVPKYDGITINFPPFPPAPPAQPPAFTPTGGGGGGKMLLGGGRLGDFGRWPARGVITPLGCGSFEMGQ